MERTSEPRSPEMLLLEEVAGIARQLAAAPDLDALLQRICDLGQTHLGPCDGVSLMLIRRGGQIATPAYSSAIASENDQAQYATGDGPCLQSIREHQTITIEDLETEDRWPAYRDRALELGVRSMNSFRLFVEGDTMGALNFYATAPRAFDPRSELLGQVFASHAAVALKAAIAESGLEAALQTRDVIGQAKGVLMERLALTADDAFAMLKQRSQELNQPLRELAADVARTGVIADTPAQGVPGRA